MSNAVEERDDSRVAVILVRPQEEGNVGAVARAMANMGLERLILVEPAPAVGGVARGFGVGGWEVLDRLERAPSLEAAIAPFRRVIGTTSTRERDLAANKVLPPRDLARRLVGELAPRNVDDPHPDELCAALVFGPEHHGLSRRELELCHPVVAVPCSSEHPTLNLAQAVLIVAYELFLARSELAGDPLPTIHESATAIGRAELLRQIEGTLVRVGFDDPEIHRLLMRDLRRLLARSEASDRELRVLRRILNRAAKRLPGESAGEERDSSPVSLTE